MKVLTIEEQIEQCKIELRANNGDKDAICILRREHLSSLPLKICIFIVVMLLFSAFLWIIIKKPFLDILILGTQFWGTICFAEEVLVYIFPPLSGDEYTLICPFFHMVGHSILIRKIHFGELESIIICTLTFILITKIYLKESSVHREIQIKTRLDKLEIGQK